MRGLELLVELPRTRRAVPSPRRHRSARQRHDVIAPEPPEEQALTADRRGAGGQKYPRKGAARPIPARSAMSRSCMTAPSSPDAVHAGGTRRTSPDPGTSGCAAGGDAVQERPHGGAEYMTGALRPPRRRQTGLCGDQFGRRGPACQGSRTPVSRGAPGRLDSSPSVSMTGNVPAVQMVVGYGDGHIGKGPRPPRWRRACGGPESRRRGVRILQDALNVGQYPAARVCRRRTLAAQLGVSRATCVRC